MYLPLFIIERSINANVVHYDAKLSDDGNLDPQEPVVAYWVMAAKDGHRQELNLLERAKAYGFTVHPDASGKFYHMELVSQRRRDIHVYREGDMVRAETLIAGQPAYLQKVFVSARHLVLLPTPEYVEMFVISGVAVTFFLADLARLLRSARQRLEKRFRNGPAPEHPAVCVLEYSGSQHTAQVFRIGSLVLSGDHVAKQRGGVLELSGEHRGLLRRTASYLKPRLVSIAQRSHREKNLVRGRQCPGEYLRACRKILRAPEALCGNRKPDGVRGRLERLHAGRLRIFKPRDGKRIRCDRQGHQIGLDWKKGNSAFGRASGHAAEMLVTASALIASIIFELVPVEPALDQEKFTFIPEGDRREIQITTVIKTCRAHERLIFGFFSDLGFCKEFQHAAPPKCLKVHEQNQGRVRRKTLQHAGRSGRETARALELHKPESRSTEQDRRGNQNPRPAIFHQDQYHTIARALRRLRFNT